MTCAADQPVRHFPGIGFRPAEMVAQRDQYGDRSIWVVGDDCPLGKADPLAFLHHERCYREDFFAPCVNGWEIAMATNLTSDPAPVPLGDTGGFMVAVIAALILPRAFLVIVPARQLAGVNPRSRPFFFPRRNPAPPRPAAVIRGQAGRGHHITRTP